jgi:hypothetical protein
MASQACHSYYKAPSSSLTTRGREVGTRDCGVSSLQSWIVNNVITKLTAIFLSLHAPHFFMDRLALVTPCEIVSPSPARVMVFLGLNYRMG